MQCMLLLEVSEWSREGVVLVEWASTWSRGRDGSGERKRVQLAMQVPDTNRARRTPSYLRGARDIRKEDY
jgi:hypothetical protein